jgi:hypothetical protein
LNDKGDDDGVALNTFCDNVDDGYSPEEALGLTIYEADTRADTRVEDVAEEAL